MKLTCHSEYLPLASVYIKTAADACIDDKKLKAEWETLNYLSCPELLESKIEYIAFETILKKEGVTIHYFSRDKHLSLDSMYCRDASIATNHGMIICTMGKEGRRLEPEAQQRTFQANDITVLGAIKAPGTLEGGDVAWLNEKTVAVGHTYRTNEEGIRQLKTFLTPIGVEVIVVDLPHYKGTEDVFHLMSIISPVDKDLAVVYSPLMPIRFRNQLLQMGFELVEVPEDEFESLGCNVLAIGPRKCVMVMGNPKTQAALERKVVKYLRIAVKKLASKGVVAPLA